MPVATPKPAAMVTAVQPAVASPKSAALATPVSGGGVMASPGPGPITANYGVSFYGLASYGIATVSAPIAVPVG